MALFGAIVAVGLGPALWLGAQFGNVTIAPVQPPAVVGEQRVDTDKAPGGAGAATEEPAAIEPTRRSGYLPLSSTPSARSSATAEPEATEPDAEPTTEPTGDAVEPTPTDEPSTPPTEDTTAPTDPPSSGDGDEDEPGDDPPPGEPVGRTTGVRLASR
jgi:hypothetical protein